LRLSAWPKRKPKKESGTTPHPKGASVSEPRTGGTGNSAQQHGTQAECESRQRAMRRSEHTRTLRKRGICNKSPTQETKGGNDRAHSSTVGAGKALQEGVGIQELGQVMRATGLRITRVHMKRQAHVQVSRCAGERTKLFVLVLSSKLSCNASHAH
jgi:hypothetical protein